METMKLRFTTAVAGKLAAAPHSTAKSELIEELSDNLYHRYLDLTAAGVPREEAYQQALDCLGDTGELVEYLNSLQPDESLPELLLRPDQGDSGQLDDLLKNVEEIVKGALDKAKGALRDAKSIAEDNLGISADDLARETKEKVGQAFQKAKDVVGAAVSPREPADGEFEIHADGYDDDHGEHPWGEDHEDQADPAEPTGAGRGGQDASHSWQFSVGYNRDRGGFFTQWENSRTGEGGGVPVPLDEPIFGQALTGLDVQVSGDVDIRLTEAEDGDVVIRGDVERLEAFRSEDGVLTIRQDGKTASSSFFFRRGLYSADVSLALPRRWWKFIRVSTADGDVNLSGDVALGLVSVKTASGDLDGRLPQCECFSFKSASGDLEWEGCADELQAETVSGDLTFRGQLSRIGKLSCKSVSGDIDWEGTAQEAQFQTVSGDILANGQLGQVQATSVSGEVEVSGAVAGGARCSSSSGGIRLESAALPQRMDLSSKSGDCEVRIPDAGPFTVHFKTTSGRFQSDFFTGNMGGRHNTFTYREDDAADGSVPTYRISSVSGNLYLYQY